MPPLLQDALVSGYIRYRKQRLGQLQTPTAIILYVTNRCNLRCGHCFYWDSLNRRVDELTLDELAALNRSFEHPVSLSLTGGEPFIRKDFGEIVRLFRTGGRVREIGIATNGYYTDAVIALGERHLAEQPGFPLSFQVSLDGLEETHDRVRGLKGSFSRALETVHRLKALAARAEGFSVSVGVAVQKQNLSEMAELIDLLGPLGIEIRVNLVRGETSGTFGVSTESSSHADPKEGSDIALDTAEMQGLYGLLCEKNRQYGFWTERLRRVYEIGMQVMCERRKVLDCYAGTIDAVIYANGDVAFCELTKPVGSLRDCGFDLRRLWHGPDAEAMRRRVRSCFCTHGCNISTSLMFDAAIVKEAIRR